MSFDSHAPGCTVASDGTVTFVYRDAAASAVAVAGDFTGWARGAIPMTRVPGTDRWVVEAKFASDGLHTYKYLVDGAWVADPDNRLARNDGFGGRNSAFVAGGRVLGGKAVRFTPRRGEGAGG